jgi:hypothetical protein
MGMMVDFADPTEREESGRFLPGVSGNPGGRPSRDRVLHRLSSRRGGEAVRALIEALGDDAGLIVIDARGVLAELVALREAEFDDALAENELGGVELSPAGAAAMARGRREAELWKVFDAEWDREDERRPLDGGGVELVTRYRHRASGVVLGHWPLCAKRDAWVAGQLGLEAAGEAP